MPIYIIRAGAHGPVKIGYSKSEDALCARLAMLQAANPERLTLLRLLDGDVRIEQDIHSRFDHLRIHGEWFAFNNAMLGTLGVPEYIASTAITIPVPLHPLERRMVAGASTSRTRREKKLQADYTVAAKNFASHGNAILNRGEPT